MKSSASGKSGVKRCEEAANATRETEETNYNNKLGANHAL